MHNNHSNLQISSIAQEVISSISSFLKHDCSLPDLESSYWLFYNDERYATLDIMKSIAWEDLYELMYRSSEHSLSSEDNKYGLLDAKGLHKALELLITPLVDSLQMEKTLAK